jgi:hypothetical protein
MSSLREKIAALEKGFHDAESYSRTLQHVLRRSEDAKLSELATLKA